MEGSQSYPSGANFKDELHRAIETKDTPRARSILERRDVQDFIRRPRFFWHEVQNEIPVHNSNFCPEILKLLLEYGADPNSVCEYDGPGPLKDSFESLLGHAVRCNQPEAVKVLLSHKADIEGVSWVGNLFGSPLKIAKALGHRHIVRIILDYQENNAKHHPAGSESQVVVPALTQSELSKLKANIELGSQLKEHLKSHVQRRKELEDQKNQAKQSLDKLEQLIREEDERFNSYLSNIGAHPDYSSSEDLAALINKKLGL